MTASSAGLDFTNVKDGGGSFNKKRQPAGDYKAKITKVEDKPSKKDNVMQWLFTIQVGSGTYPYYCKHEENQLWKIRNLFIAAGKSVPKKRVKVNPNDIVGREIAVTLEDDEYDGKLQSNIASTFPLSELEGEDVSDDDDDTDDDDDEDTPAVKSANSKAAAKAKAAVQDDDDDDDEDDTPPPPKKKKAEPVYGDEEDDEDEEPAPKAKKKPAKVEVDDDELEELDIDDV